MWRGFDFVGMFKSAIKKALGAVGNACYMPLWRRALKAAGERPLLIVDIDNTIADTHAYERSSPDRIIRIAELAPLEPMRMWLLEHAETHRILYLSARNYWDAARTKAWLLRHRFPFQSGSLVLVTRPQDKLPFLRRAAGHPAGVTYIDDLSYQSTSGDIRFHDAVIDAVRGLGIRYLDLQFISNLCSPAQAPSP